MSHTRLHQGTGWDGAAGVPDKIENVAVIDAQTLAVANDNTDDEAGTWVGAGKTNQLLVIAVPAVPGVGSGVAPAATPVG